jgi:hypothetical protein
VYGDYRVDFDEHGVVLYRDGQVLHRESDDTSFAGGLVADEGVTGCPVTPRAGDLLHVT